MLCSIIFKYALDELDFHESNGRVAHYSSIEILEMEELEIKAVTYRGAAVPMDPLADMDCHFSRSEAQHTQLDVYSQNWWVLCIGGS